MFRNPYYSIAIITLSVTINAVLGFYVYYQHINTPNHDDQMLLGEMTKMVIDSEEYKELESRLKIYSIKPIVKGGFNSSNTYSVKNYEIHVLTEIEDYIFSCSDNVCSDVVNENWTYSRYIDDKEPLLPLK